MIGKIKITNIGGSINIENGTIQQYLSYTGTIEPNTFIELIDDNGTTKIKTATTKIDGLTKSKVTTSVTGKVWILNQEEEN